MMKALLVATISLMFLVGCTDKAAPPSAVEEDAVEGRNEQITEEPKKEPQEELNEEEDTPVEEEIVSQDGLFLYRPSVGSIMTFTNAGVEMFVHEVVATNDEYVQITVTLGGAPATQIYKWTSDEITLVFEDAAPVDPSEDRLDDFEQMEEPETLIHLKGEAKWELVDTAESITVPAGTFEDVYVIKLITDDVEGEESIFTRYYAPGIGLIKEEFELTGENGYTDGATLTTVE
ncbi:hypothetical protein [Bacillus suaedae]|uniref:Uncharacterized protein n=1 Tax=Halalkalibacter suaedae TaxID=2822140 RepID=A0A940WR03_9BACI|nr:hypothetical protein [Bacillus suaedae]MBP3950213.1 hypothetical protein [Bacillus suaedae]